MTDSGGKDLVSVIVPVYKVEEYIRECLDSITGQTYKNLEIILVDDGSPDSSGEICEEYARNDSRITVYHKENGGLSDARNYGIARAHGEFLTFVDSDDVIKSNFVETLLGLIHKYDADIATAPFVNFRNYADWGGGKLRRVLLNSLLHTSGGTIPARNRSQCMRQALHNGEFRGHRISERLVL